MPNHDRRCWVWMPEVFRGRAMVALALLVAGVGGLAEEPSAEDHFSRAQSDYVAGRYDSALEAAARVTLEPRNRTYVWSLEYAGVPQKTVWLGRRYGYLIGLKPRDAYLRGGRGYPHLRMRDRLDLPTGFAFSSGDPLVTCIDLHTGRRLWTLPGRRLGRYAVHPEDDTLWGWHANEDSAVVRYLPEHGRIELQGTIEKGGPPSPRGIRVNGVQLWDRAGSREVTQAGLTRGDEFDLTTGITKKSVVPPEYLSPNRLYSIQQVGQRGFTQLRLEPATVSGGGHASWTFAMSGYADRPPQWVAGDVLAFSGASSSRQVYRLDGVSGLPRWASVLRESVYRPLRSMRGGASDPARRRAAATRFKSALYVEGYLGGVYRFDYAEGSQSGRYVSGDTLIAPPAVTDEGAIVVLAGTRQLRALPARAWDHLLTEDDLAIRTRKLWLDCLLALDRSEEAKTLATQWAALAAGEPELWRLCAGVYERLGQVDEARGARGLAMTVGSERRDETLAREIGLLDRLPVANVTAPLIDMGPLVLIAGRDGRLTTYAPGSRSIVSEEQSDANVRTLTRRGREVIATLTTGREVTLRVIPSTKEEPSDPLAEAVADLDVDSRKAWTRNARRGSVAVRAGDHWVRPIAGGSVSILDPATRTVVEHAPLIPEVGAFTLTPFGGGWLAHGERGVYATEPVTLRPQRLLVDAGYHTAGNSRSGARKVPLLASGPDGFACLSTNDPTDRLQSFLADGPTHHRRVEVRRLKTVPRLEDQRNRLTRQGEGYLYVGAEIIYLPDDPSRPVVLFDPCSLQLQGPGFQRSWYALFDAPHFLPGRKMLVTHTEGGAYLFDLKILTGA